MYLKKVELQGFKSFADKVSLEFKPGITAVVGPNGSGKSNISDAFRWVLGEQSAKTLRGSRMEDVIFAGTEQRKPLNFCEVTLILDNTDSVLPTEYSEVSITRRLYRSGESEYYINKSACRLKDIYELFLDTGIGRDGYSIIGQGRIDEILSTKSEDRRNIFEEASGIMKYKTRKIEAEKKLESTKQNLLRINDIISELETQLEPLREQSEKAKKYLGLAEELKILDINLFIENYSKLKEKLIESKEQLSQIEASLAEYSDRLESLDDSSNKTDELNKELDNTISGLNQQLFEVEKNIEKTNSEINLIKEKLLNTDNNKQRILNEINLLNQKKSSIENEICAKNEKLKGLESDLSDINAYLLEKEDMLSNHNEALEISINEIEDLKSEIIEKHNEISSKKSLISNYQIMLDNIKTRNNQIDDEMAKISIEKEVHDSKYENLKNDIQRLEINFAQKLDEIKNLILRKNEIDQKIKQNNEKLDKTKNIIATKISRHSLLLEMDKEYEGFNKSVKSILQACEKSSILGKGVHGALVQLMSVPKKYETAIEVALGGALQNIVTDDEESAERLIDYLKMNNLGRATFLPITSVKPREADNQLSRLLSQNGVLGIAADTVSFDKKYEGIFKNLLGKVLVVDNIKNAVNIAKKHNYSFKIVTLEGEVLNPGGSISGGSSNRTTNLLSRSREIEELFDEIGRLKVELKEIEDNISVFNREYYDTQSEIEAQEKSNKENELILAANKTEIKQISEITSKYDERIRVMNIEKEQLNEQKIKSEYEIKVLEDKIVAMSKEIEEMSEKTSLNQEKYKKDIEERDNLINIITNEKIKMSGLNQEILSVKDYIQKLNIDAESIHSQVKNNLINIEALTSEYEGFNENIQANEDLLIQLKNSKEELLKNLSDKNFEKSELETAADSFKKQWKELNSTITLISNDKSKIEVKATKLEMELEALQNRIWEEYELTYTKCLEFQQDISQYSNPNKAISELKSSINALGTINVSAIEEYIKVKERFEFLSKQRDDLETAEKSLRKVINEMLEIMENQFIEQFEIINSNFNDVFKELFGGGRAHLILSDPDNVLESGIEIEAQPPGKKLQSLNLLSGGERALTAIAILFAMLKVRPTPFCILDEIEAALDDVNVYRFADYVKKYADKTQFLIITHRKGTMEIADLLYGVTMQEHGVSRLVSVKLSEQAS